MNEGNRGIGIWPPMGQDYVKKYGPGPHVAVDALVTTLDYKVLLIRRKDTNQLALPGGFVEPGEHLIEAAWRETREEAGVPLFFHTDIVKVYADPSRDPRARIISIVHKFMLEVESSAVPVKAGDDAKEALWYPLSAIQLRPLPFYADHQQIIRDMT
ncbi:NUDIX hydrolase [Brucella intermedia]|uniref:NUDIX hydrolase n=1 Tax=Brucella intermedia TaxID=94625 RepID=UPI00224B74CA|nr:NUDIX hydrolase [Brucella intermedia]